jgi:exodeoxyribonuclease VII large subunit
MCLPDGETLRKQLEVNQQRLLNLLHTQLEQHRLWLDKHALVILQNAVLGAWRETSQKTDDLMRRLDQATAATLERRQAKLKQLQAMHAALNPLSILERGYAVVRGKDQRKPITDVSELAIKETLRITFYRGKIAARVIEIKND